MVKTENVATSHLVTLEAVDGWAMFPEIIQE